MKDQVIDKITGDSPEAKSLDITQQNIEQLKQLFPDVFSENKIDFEALKAVLGAEVDDSEERYNFTWNGKTKARQIAQTPSTGTLRPSKEESVNWDTTENLFIEGDNLEVLKLLQKSYHKKVKVIYIDPPYNTGKDFVYKDNFHNNIRNYLVQTEQLDSKGYKKSTNLNTSGRYHTDWLNMMYPRLKLARNLLTEDGVIFISIDDNEVCNLRKICDEIYGEDNFLTILTVQVRYEGKTLVEDMDFQKLVENVLVYTKSKKEVILNKKTVEYNYDKFNFEIIELKSPEVIELGNKRVEVFKAGAYEIIKRQPAKDLLKEIWASGTILDGNSSGRFFRDYLAGRQDVDGLGTLYKVEGIGDDQNAFRYFTGPKREGATKGKYYQGIPNDVLNNPDDSDRKIPITTFLDLAGSFGNCRHEGSVDFRSGKKPIKLLCELFSIIKGNDDDVYLDFFSGSASTAHAVMHLNNENNTKNKFIMVQLPEETDSHEFKTICEIGKERIRRAGNKLQLENTELDVGFKVLKLDETNIRPWDADFDNLESVLRQATESIKADRSNEDILYEILLKYGIELTVPVETEIVNGKQVFVVGAGALIVCLDDGITSEVVEGIAKLKDKLDPEITQVVFKDAGFADSNVKTNAMQILKQAGVDDVKSI